MGRNGGRIEVTIRVEADIGLRIPESSRTRMAAPVYSEYKRRVEKAVAAPVYVSSNPVKAGAVENTNPFTLAMFAARTSSISAMFARRTALILLMSANLDEVLRG